MTERPSPTNKRAEHESVRRLLFCEDDGVIEHNQETFVYQKLISKAFKNNRKSGKVGLSAKNPSKGEEVTLRTPKEILKEMGKLYEESAEGFE